MKDTWHNQNFFSPIIF